MCLPCHYLGYERRISVLKIRETSTCHSCLKNFPLFKRQDRSSWHYPSYYTFVKVYTSFERAAVVLTKARWLKIRWLFKLKVEDMVSVSVASSAEIGLPNEWFLIHMHSNTMWKFSCPLFVMLYSTKITACVVCLFLLQKKYKITILFCNVLIIGKIT